MRSDKATAPGGPLDHWPPGPAVAVVSHVIEGHVSRGFEAVRDAFEENFARRGELGGACCAYYRGEKCRPLGWGPGQASAAPWERDTMVLVHSATRACRR